MNIDLIRNFEQQCWNHQANCIDTEQFTRLIVAECVAMVDKSSVIFSDYAGVKTNVQEIGVRINRHFGINT